jgi:hypothetical protein
VKITLTILVLCVAVGLLAQTPSEADHHAGVVQRGESSDGMGFSQTTTTHHFILTPNGGIVQVTANDPNNTGQIETIQMHMKHIAEMFSEGNPNHSTRDGLHANEAIHPSRGRSAGFALQAPNSAVSTSQSPLPKAMAIFVHDATRLRPILLQEVASKSQGTAIVVGIPNGIECPTTVLADTIFSVAPTV